MKNVVYEIVSPSGKRYIGSARDFQKRKSWHRSALRRGIHHSRPLQRAWSKYGDDLRFRVILVCRERDLFFYEQSLIDGMKPEYNVNPTASGTRGLKWSEESKAKLRGRKNDGAAISRGMKQAIPADERVLRARHARSGWTKESLASYAVTRKLNGRSESSKRKVSEATKAMWQNPEMRAKRIESIRAAKISKIQSIDKEVS